MRDEKSARQTVRVVEKSRERMKYDSNREKDKRQVEGEGKRESGKCVKVREGGGWNSK